MIVLLNNCPNQGIYSDGILYTKRTCWVYRLGMCEKISFQSSYLFISKYYSS